MSEIPGGAMTDRDQMKDLQTPTPRQLLDWRDRILSEVETHMEAGRIAEAEACLHMLGKTTTDETTLAKTDRYLPSLARGRNVVASFDPLRQPTADEVVIIYGNYPHMFTNVVVNNPIQRHVSHFWSFRNDKVESDPRWSGVDRIFVINMEERVDRYDSLLRELASARAPLDRLTRIAACRPESDDKSELGGQIACLQSHIATLRKAQAERHDNVLVLEDDFCFTSDIDQHLTDLAMFFERRYPYWICLVATSKYGAIEPKDDLVSLSFQRVTNTAGYLLSRDGLERLLPVFESALERLKATGDSSTAAVDRCWAVLQPSEKFFVFRRKFGFQVSSFSNIEQNIFRYLD
ncbi:glycosyltransferase family 25 protein [Bauldia litoralis]|uniref:Glycosyltransferase family 25 (LPS biosynthesis protein) n=1 Tax=Bauldia litoralis TaxID=665467 RepID=A0A1G6E9X9_9HYPH|nr:glycosyltransferase family 25 protein [Bauldia litoralis]SDB54206.1 Glycosyltransferase family 25 (LPS biosynthesis protein) [Bauldia litoralis]